MISSLWLRCILALTGTAAFSPKEAGPRMIHIPTIDLSEEQHRHVIVARGTESVYQGHPTTALMADHRTLFCVWTLNHGGPCGPMKRSDDGGLTWSDLLPVPKNWSTARNCPSIYRLVDPAGTERTFVFAGGGPDHCMYQSHSENQGETWSDPSQLPAALSGDRHMPRYARDGRLVVCFRDTASESPTKNHFVAWIGTYEDILSGREGQYRVKLLHSNAGGDCGYSGLEILPDGTFIATTYVKYDLGQAKHSVISVRFTLDELDRKVEAKKR